MKKKKVISPIAIDLGAKNTGVYFAHYSEGDNIQSIKKEGRIYQLEQGKYTLLMANRTAKRHQRRGYDRKQMVKRLFQLIWEKYFQLEWNDSVQQTIGFLMNRRGFTFLTEEYDLERLRQFPKEVYDELPEELKSNLNNNDDEYDFASALTEWTNEDQEKIKNLLEAINKRPKEICRRLVFIEKTNKLKEYCSMRIKGDRIPEEKKKSLSQLHKWILEEWHKEGSQDLPAIPLNNNHIDMVKYLNEKDEITAKNILNVFSSDYSPEKKKLKDDFWCFKSEKFNMEKVNFNPPDNKSQEGSNTKEQNKYKKTHLNHLAFALYKINDEFESGGRHRSKYFEEVKSVLESKDHSQGYLKEFCKNLQSCSFNNGSEPLTVEKLTNLIGHLSNMELKPLRKYFNDKKHRNGDYWDEARLNNLFNRWILSEWRVNLEKDKQKITGEKGDYKELCKYWRDWKKEFPDTVVNFWLKTDPFYTIPPYQDNNNRHPPKCQSLVLNSEFLNNNYPEWQSWLKKLKALEKVEKYLENYEEDLKDLKSGKGKSYFSDKETTPNKKNGRPKSQQELKAGNQVRRTLKDLNACTLQFIFDRVKATDPLKLNEIFSHAKKWRQEQSTEKEKQESKIQIENTIKESVLSSELKTDRDYSSDSLFKERTFFHLVCKYYKQRQRAKDGRLFIHPDYKDNCKKKRGFEEQRGFDNENCLLTYCNNKPRQKKHQSFYDITDALQVSPQQLEKIIGSDNNEKVIEWLKEKTTSLSSNCERAAKEQKDRRGHLKSDIQSVYGIVYHNYDKQRKEVLRNSKIQDAFALYSFCERAKKLCHNLTERLYDVKKQEGWKTDLERNPSAAVYLLAKLNNIIFKDRSGNSNTCPICSADNAQRMQLVKDTMKDNSINYSSKAQRLPAIPTRLIDGAVKRIAQIVGGSIAADKWKKIEGELEAGNHVRIPIITESNRFEFEPSKDELVKPQRTKARKGTVLLRGGDGDSFESKKERIKAASMGICPYTGRGLNNSEEINHDHIIPRSSKKYGKLNDEANFIYASVKGNKDKGDKIYNLTNLHDDYKQKQFETTNNTKITGWIEEQIGNGQGELFKFGPYRSFINLTADQQKAFRHALFLEENHSLRKKVINAIDNRTKTFVNGTQRYFAEVLANNLYKKAKLINKQKLLSFDYFGVEAHDNSRGDGVYNLRKQLVNDYREDLKKYNKNGGKNQPSYSHLIDAQVAFCMAVDAHCKEGSLNLKLGETGLWSRINKETGEIYDAKLFKTIQVDPKDLDIKKLERQIPKPEEKNVGHRPLFNENAVALHFLKLIEIKDPNQETKYFQGFLSLSELKKCLKGGGDNFDDYKKYASELTNTDVNTYKFLYTDRFAIKNGQGSTIITGFGEKQITVRVYNLDKKKVCKFLIDHFHTASNIDNWNSEKNDEVKILKILYKLQYFTKRQKVIKKDNNKKNNNGEKLNSLKKESEKKCAGFINPQIEMAWSDLQSSIDDKENLQPQLKKYFLCKQDDRELLKHNHEHKKVAKDFSLPISCSSGYLIRKKNWQGETVYYCRPCSNDFSQTVLHKNEDGTLNEKDERLANVYRQNSLFFWFKNFNQLKEKLEPIDKELAIDANLYYPAQKPEDFKDYLVKVENRRTDAERPKFIFYLKEDKRMDFTTFKEFVLKYKFRNLQDLKGDLRKKWIEGKFYCESCESLKKSIKEVKSMKKKPNKLLPTLEEMRDLFEESQKNKILAYSAKGKFTLD